MPDAPVTRVVEDYLKVIWKSGEWSEEGLSTNELAGTLGVSASTVSTNLSKLAREGFVLWEPYGGVRLSEVGRAIAVAMVRKHRLIETYLVEVHGYSWDEVHDEAEVLEHAVSDRLLDSWDRQLGFPTHDPHGDPIPRPDGSIAPMDGIRLVELPIGAVSAVVRVSDHDSELLRYLEGLGVRVGASIEVLARHPFADSTTVRLAGSTFDLAGVVTAAVWVAGS